MAKTTAWYGELRTKRGNIVVIKDDDLPKPATEGRIYLYNTEREEMVEYVEAIVADKLFPLDSEQQKDAEKKFKSGFEAAKKQLNKANGKSAPEEEPKPEADDIDDALIETDDADVDDEFEED